MKALELSYTLTQLTGLDISLEERTSDVTGVGMVYRNPETGETQLIRFPTIKNVTDVSIEFWLGETIHFIRDYNMRQ
jgi:hypothetical protein